MQLALSVPFQQQQYNMDKKLKEKIFFNLEQNKIEVMKIEQNI